MSHIKSNAGDKILSTRMDVAQESVNVLVIILQLCAIAVQKSCTVSVILA